MIDAGDLAVDAEPSEADREDIARLMLQLRAKGLSERRVLAAIEQVPRRLFLGAADKRLAHRDCAAPIECGQTASEPGFVALTTELLELDERCRVLEIGTGSGYQTAVLARLAARVFSVERFRTLALLARERLQALRIANTTIRVADGHEGWPEEAPFDRILLSAAVEHVPAPLLTQLAPGGILLAPIGAAGTEQHLVRFTEQAGAFGERILAPVRVVSLMVGVAALL